MTTGAAPESAHVPNEAPTPVDAPTPVAVPGRPRWGPFAVLAVTALVIDQLVKSWAAGSFRLGEPVPVLGEALRITVSHNQGALFGLFQGSAVVLGLVSLLVVGLIVWYEARAGASLIVSIALGLLLGGAMGNLTDRLRLGYVIDYVDAGLGDVRWFTFNLSDVAIDGAILLLILVALLPERRAEQPA